MSTSTITDKMGIPLPVMDDGGEQIPYPDYERIELFGDAVLVRRFTPKDRTNGGILLPDQAQKTQPRGEVLAVGPGRIREDGKRYPLPVVPGDIVILGGPVANVHLNGDEKNLFVVDVDSLYGVVKSHVRFSR